MIPFLYGGNAHPGSLVSGSLVLPANGGSVAIPLLVPHRMVAQSITAHTADTSGSHSLEAAFYDDAKMECVGTAGSWVYTSTIATVRTGPLTEVELQPGSWWLVIRNIGASTTALGRVALGTLAGSVAATAQLAELAHNLSAETWVKTSSLPLIRVNGTIEFNGVVFN